jgi:SHS2 domain-containing protein
MQFRPYETFDHTADLGLRVHGKTLEELFSNAAYALFDTMADLQDLGFDVKKQIAVEGLDLPELMVTWLNQLLFLWESELILFGRFEVHRVSDSSLEATVWGERYEQSTRELFTDIKAATYHNLSIKQGKGYWTAEIVLDI